MRISDWSSDVCSSDLRGVERRQTAVAPGRPAGDEDDAVRIGDDDVVLLARCPAAHDLVEAHLHHHGAEDPFAIRYLRGEVVAALAGGGAEREVAAEAALHGVLEVGPVAEVLTDEGGVHVPIAGGEGDRKSGGWGKRVCVW